MSKIIVEVIYVTGKVNKFTFDTTNQVEAFKVGLFEAFENGLSYTVKAYEEEPGLSKWSIDNQEGQ